MYEIKWNESVDESFKENHALLYVVKCREVAPKLALLPWWWDIEEDRGFSGPLTESQQAQVTLRGSVLFLSVTFPAPESLGL